MIGTKTRNILILAVVFLGTNLSFLFLHYFAERLVPRDLAVKRYSQAFADGHITAEQYPFKAFGHGALQNLDGIDQYSECVNALMTIYRNDEHPWKNAIIPGYQSFEDEQYCDALKKIVVDHSDAAPATVVTKPRLWFGTKALTLLLLPGFEIFQIYEFLKLFSFLGFALLLAVAFAHSRRQGWATMPITVIGIFGSGIPYYGGIANALPFAVALYLGLGMAVVMYSGNSLIKKSYALIAGSVMAFFYLTDGSLILALSFMIYVVYFLGEHGRTLKHRWQDLFMLATLFMLGFFFSFLAKQFIAAIVLDFHTVWQQFVDMVLLRMSTRGGPDWNRWQAFYGQLGAYDLAVLWNQPLFWVVAGSSAIGWLTALVITVINTTLSRSIEHCSALVVFFGIALVVFCRYYLMTNHSFEHWFIVCRYVFVLYAAGISAALYQAYDLRTLIRK